MSFFKNNKETKTEDLALSDLLIGAITGVQSLRGSAARNAQISVSAVADSLPAKNARFSPPNAPSALRRGSSGLTFFTYDIKFTKGLVPGSSNKIEVVEYLKSKLGAETFVGGFKNYNFNIFVDKTDHFHITDENKNIVEAKGKGLSS